MVRPDLASLARRVNDLCMEGVLHDDLTYVYQAVYAIARAAPPDGWLPRSRAYSYQLYAALKENDPNCSTILLPRVYRDIEPRGRWFASRSLVGLLPQGPFPAMLAREGLDKMSSFPYQEASIAIRHSRYRGEGWLILADPAELTLVK